MDQDNRKKGRLGALLFWGGLLVAYVAIDAFIAKRELPQDVRWVIFVPIAIVMFIVRVAIQQKSAD
jgi:hypothetical protein